MFVCRNCGCEVGVFGNGNPRKYCSKECYRIVAARISRASRSWHKKQCNACGEWFRTQEKRKRHCSQRCSQSMRLAGKPLKSNRVCVGCGSEFRKKYSGRNKGLYCSRECAFKNCQHYNRSPKHPISDGILEWAFGWKKCRVCRCDFYATKTNSGICSDECRKQRAREKAGNWYNQKHGDTRPCASCGNVINRNGKRMCEECRRIGKAESRRASKSIRRAREKTNGPYELIRATAVFKRDEWICRLCNQPTESHEKVPHPRAPTIDHIMPISKGGTHTMDNVQCACFECNWMKADNTEHNEHA